MLLGLILQFLPMIVVLVVLATVLRNRPWRSRLDPFETPPRELYQDLRPARRTRQTHADRKMRDDNETSQPGLGRWLAVVTISVLALMAATVVARYVLLSPLPFGFVRLGMLVVCCLAILVPLTSATWMRFGARVSAPRNVAETLASLVLLAVVIWGFLSDLSRIGSSSALIDLPVEPEAASTGVVGVLVIAMLAGLVAVFNVYQHVRPQS